MLTLPQLLRKLREELRGRRDAYAVLTLMGASLLGVGAANISARRNFEAEFTVTTLDLETAGAPQLFLNAVNDVPSLSVNTDRAMTLSLDGRFSAEDDPELNKAIENLGSTLEIEIGEGGAWTIELAQDAEPGDGMTVEDVTLDRTQVKRLRLRGSDDRPALRFEFASAADTSAGMLHLTGGAASFQLVLENATIAGLDRPAGGLLELTFSPSSFDRRIDLPTAGTVSSDLPPVPSNGSDKDSKKPEPIYCQGCIWGDLETEGVRLAETLELGDDLAEERVQSAIVAGTVRMADKSLKVEPGQFFLAGRPGIAKVQDIQLDPESGLMTVRVSGKSKEVAVGIDPGRPISTISASVLVTLLGQVGAATALTFCTGWVSAGMMWVVTSLFKREKD